MQERVLDLLYTMLVSQPSCRSTEDTQKLLDYFEFQFKDIAVKATSIAKDETATSATVSAAPLASDEEQLSEKQIAARKCITKLATDCLSEIIRSLDAMRKTEGEDKKDKGDEEDEVQTGTVERHSHSSAGVVVVAASAAAAIGGQKPRDSPTATDIKTVVQVNAPEDPEVVALLRSLGFEEFAPLLRAGDVDMEVLAKLSESDLRSIKLPFDVSRKIFRALTAKLRSRATQSVQLLILLIPPLCPVLEMLATVLKSMIHSNGFTSPLTMIQVRVQSWMLTKLD